MLNRIVCFGDSITQGGEEGRWSDLLAEAVEPRGVEVINAGHGGDTTANAFDRLEAELFPHLPALVITEFGINDANVRPWARVARVGVGEYEKNLREIHRVVTLRGGTLVLVANHILNPAEGKYAHQGNGEPYQHNLEPYNARVRRLGRELDLCVIDIAEYAARAGVAVDRMLAPDGVHLSAEGTRCYAAAVAEAIVARLHSW